MQKARQDVTAFFGNLNKHLQTRTYLVGESITLADITAFSALVQPFALVRSPLRRGTVAHRTHTCHPQVLDRKFRDPFVNVLRWFSTIASQPEVRAVVGDVPMCETAQTAPAAGAAAALQRPRRSRRPLRSPRQRRSQARREAQARAQAQGRGGRGGGFR